MTAVLSPIALDEAGIAYIEGTTLKVVELVRVWRREGLTPEHLQAEFPHLTLEQVYAALGYYHGHRAALDADLERRDLRAEQIRDELGQHPAAERLRSIGSGAS